MRILHVVAYYPPERMGGIGEFVAGLHEGLLAAGHDSLVLTTGRVSTDRVRRIAPSALGWFLGSTGWTRRAAEFDIVHFQAGEAFPLLACLAFWPKRRARILATFHVDSRGIAGAFRPYTIEGRAFARERRTWIYRNLVCRAHRMLDTWAVHLADCVNTISKQSALEMLGARRAADADVIYCGVRPPEPSAESCIASVDLLYAGAAGHRKRVAMLPHILRRVRERVPNARMRIVGFSFAEAAEVERLFAEFGLLDHVAVVGRIESAQIAPYYRAASCLVVPSAYEGLPLVILEAMQCGLPVVATRVSGHPEAIVDGENGFLVEVDQPGPMAERCARLIQDAELRQRLGRAAEETVRARFTLEREVAEYLALYERLKGRDAAN